MTLDLPPDLQELVRKRIESGAYASVEDVLRSALVAQDAAESWPDNLSSEERRAIAAQIEEGYLQSERGEVMDAEQAWKEIEATVAARRKARGRAS